MPDEDVTLAGARDADPPCVFCRIAAGAAPAHVVWADAEHVAFLDTAPVAPGHLLLVPRRHVPAVADLEPDAYARLFARVRALAGPVAAAAGAPRVGIAVEGFGVDHAHVHLVPVWRGGDLDPCRQAPAPDEALRAAAARVRAALGVPELGGAATEAIEAATPGTPGVAGTAAPPGAAYAVRALAPADAAGVAALLAALGYPAPPGAVAARLAALESFATAGGGRSPAGDGAAAIGAATFGAATFGAVAGERLIGLATAHALSVLHAHAPAAQLTALVVAPAARGRGVGRALVRAAEAWAAARGAARLSLASGAHRGGAHRFYEALGYADAGRRFVRGLA